MNETMAPFRIDPSAPAALAGFRERIAGEGFTKRGLLDLLSSYIDSDRRLDLDAIRLVARGEKPLHLLCRLFITGEAVPEAKLEKILGNDTLSRMVRIGLFIPEGGGLRSAGQLTPIEETLVLSDFGPEVTGRPYGPDYVLGVGSASLNLAGLTVRRKVGSALDLGTGGGIQSLFTARHADRLVGTDTNARALAFASLNFALNGTENVEVREGSLFGPVEGESFDLMVSNPPFVISPEESQGFRSATGMEGDSVSRAVVEGFGPRLNSGGFATILLNWGHESDEDWHQKPAAWASGAGCGVWLMCFDTEDPSVYARRWLKDGNRKIEGPALAKEMGRWLSYYDTLGFRRISAGALILYKLPSGPAWTRKERVVRNVLGQGECGSQVERVCLSETALAGAADDDAVLAMKPRLSPDHKLVHSMQVRDGRWSLEKSTLLNSTGFEMAGNMDIASMALLERCDGTLTLKEALEGACMALGEDPAALSKPVVFAAKNLMRKGHLFVD